MLDYETKRRIDTARDVLVGKVPDPKSQVEQITIALIYKFMDDMDAEAEELGGKRSFFVGEYEKFSWAKLMSPALGGYEVLNLYTEAFEKMTRNDGVPQLFLEIFKNAYLPYRDPETLKLFLKTINEFSYDHSEKLGDAFEYLLSVLGSQGEAGQFRTPRHIIDFMVKVIDPQKNDSILDPACGTAGFLISAYKHVFAMNERDGKPGGALTPEERKVLANNISGYDISPDMVRLSLVNLYLHGFTTPNIYEYDTLTSDERWNDYADVILANPPFMSPKGGIKPHKRFSVQSNRSEVLFVDYMAEHLTPNGRAAIIVPEGIIFQSATAYKQLRKYLIESNFLWAVVSLPAGVFNPYAGVKTSILLLDKSLAKKTDKILFVKIEKDGYDLGAQRRALCNEMGDKPELCPKHSDLPDALNTLRGWHTAVLDGEHDLYVPTVASGLLVSTSILVENGDYNLSADRYHEVILVGKQTHPMVALGNVIEYVRGVTYSKNDEVEEGGAIILRANNIDANHGTLVFDDLRRIKPSSPLKDTKLLKKNDILICSASGSAEHIGKVAISENDTPYYFGGFMGVIRVKDELEPKFLFYLLRNSHFREHIESASVGINIKNLNSSTLGNFLIPLPPLEIQRQIVDEISAHQHIIDGARQVVEGWKPNLELAVTLSKAEISWQDVVLGDITELVTKGTTPTTVGYKFEDEGINFVKIESITEDGRIIEEKLGHISIDCHNALKRSQLKSNDVLFSIAGALGRVVIVPDNILPANTNQALAIIRLKEGINPEYIAYFLKSDKVLRELEVLKVGVAQYNISLTQVSNLQIPLPPLETQREIVARIESERRVVEGCRELIAKYEENIQKVIARVWEG